MKTFSALVLSAVAFGTALLSGCATNAVDVREPTTARPLSREADAAVTGGIFQATNYRPLFEDRRARYVGDTLVVMINEKTSASSKNTGNNSRTASTQFGVPTVSGLPGKGMQGAALNANGSTKVTEQDESKNDNLFSGSITVTVVEVLSNGNLVVAGDKQIGINGDTNKLRLSGIVNPATIQPGNVVSSVQIADARIESVSRASVDPARVAGFLTRFFMSFIPFR